MEHKKFFCPQNSCQKEFGSAESLLEHRKEGHLRRIFKCPIPDCYWDFPMKKQLDKHLQDHAQYKPFICQIEGCKSKFRTQYNLSNHLVEHKMKMMIKCPAINCDEKFVTETALSLHKQLLHGEVMFKCNHCLEAPEFSSFSQWEIHQRCHPMPNADLINAMRDIKMYACQVEDCGRKYLHPQHLQKHVLETHTSRIYNCPVEGCERKFKAQCNMKRHLQTHSKINTLLDGGDNSPKEPSRSTKLGRHHKVPPGVMIYTCNIKGCGKTFSTKLHAKCHSTTHFPTEAVLCGVDGCKRQYATVEKWKHHCRIFHGITKYRSKDASCIRRFQEEEIQTDINLSQSLSCSIGSKSIENSICHPTIKETSPVLNKVSCPFPIDQTSATQDQQVQDKNRKELTHMSALETLAHIAVFEQPAGSPSTRSLNPPVGSSTHSTDSKASQNVLKNSFDGSLDRMCYTEEESLLYAKKSPVIEEHIERIEKTSENHIYNDNSTLNVIVTPPLPIQNSPPYLHILNVPIGKTSPQSQTQLSFNNIEAGHPENIDVGSIHEAEMRGELNSDKNDRTDTFCSILVHDGYIKSGGQCNGVPRNREK